MLVFFANLQRQFTVTPLQIQYADADDGTNFAKTVVRRYRNSLRILQQAVASWMEQVRWLFSLANNRSPDTHRRLYWAILCSL